MPAIEVFADVWCPFAHASLRTLVARRQVLGATDSPLVVRAWPLELVNGAPLDATLVQHEIDDLRRQATSSLFLGFDSARFPGTSLPALALAAAAYRNGPAAGEAVSLALRDALFEEGRDIADPDVLSELAAAHGVAEPTPEDEERVLADWQEGRERQVKGSPHLFCGAEEAFCPSLQISKDGEHLRVSPDLEALDQFLSGCLAH